MCWTREQGWHDRNDNPLPVGARLIALGCDCVLQRWQDNTASTLYLDPTTGRLPDPEQLNEQIPQSEWEVNRFNNQPEPPWARYAVVYLVDPETGDKWTYINKTSGAFMAYTALGCHSDATQNMRC